MRSKSGGVLSANPTVDPLTLSPETPTNVATLLHSQDSPAKLQLLSGIITEHITDGWENLVPHRLQQKLYRTLHKTIILHQHDTWLKRNAVLHPDTPFFTPIDYGRKPAKKRQLLEEEEDNPKNVRWIKQREVALTRERMWAGTPIPETNKKRSRDTPSQSSNTSCSTSSETDEWPSPKRGHTQNTTSSPHNTSSPG